MNKKVLLYADPHFFSSKRYDSKENGITKRDFLLQEMFENIGNYAKNNNIEYAIGLGDFIHDISNTTTNEVLFLHNIMTKFSKNFSIHYIISGNHDVNKYDVDYGYFVNIFKGIENAKIVYKDISTISFNDFVFYLVPYFKKDLMIKSLNELNPDDSTLNYIIGHFGESNGMHIFDSQNNDDIVPYDEIKNKVAQFKALFLGHLHFKKTFNNIQYIGSCSTHTFADALKYEDYISSNFVDWVGFTVLELDEQKKSITQSFIPTYEYNQVFLYADYNQIDEIITYAINNPEKQFVVKTASKLEDISSIKAALSKHKVKNIIMNYQVIEKEDQSLKEEELISHKVENIVDSFISKGLCRFDKEKIEKAEKILRELLS
jgi:hypothetical protein